MEDQESAGPRPDDHSSDEAPEGLPHVEPVGQFSFVPSEASQQRSKELSRLKSGRRAPLIVIFAIAGMLLLLGLMSALAPQQYPGNSLVYFVGAAAFSAIGIWTQFNPLLASITALALFVGSCIVMGIVSPETIRQALGFKVIACAVLLYSIWLSIQIQRVKNEPATG